MNNGNNDYNLDIPRPGGSSLGVLNIGGRLPPSSSQLSTLNKTG